MDQNNPQGQAGPSDQQNQPRYPDQYEQPGQGQPSQDVPFAQPAQDVPYVTPSGSQPDGEYTQPAQPGQPGGQYQSYPQSTPPPPQQADGKTIAALVMGIISCASVILGQYAFIGTALGIVGIVLGVNLRKTNPSTMASVGLVLSIVGVTVSALTVVACIACVACIGSLMTFSY